MTNGDVHLTGLRAIRPVGLLALGLCLAAPLAPPALAQQVGVTSTTTGGPLGKPPALPQRVLKVGVDVFASERITTSAADRAHLLFVDGSSLTVGPDADITIDRFVYDPATKRGALSMNAAKGVFRLVGGRITKNDEAKITVGNATIGIRGGIAIVDAANPAQLKVYFLFGDSLTFTTPQGSQTAVRPNSVIAGNPGQPPQDPRLASDAEIQGALSGLSAGSGAAGTAGSGGTQGGSGGAIEQNLQSSQVAQNNSSGAATGADTPAAGAEVANDTTGAGSGTGSTDTTPPANSEPPPTPPPPGPVTISAEGRFLRETPYTSFDNMTLAAPRDPANNATLSSASVFEGRLALTSSSGPTFDLPWAPGSVFAVTDGTSSLGPLSGTGFVSPSGNFYFYDLEETANGNNRVGLFGGDLTPVSGLPTTGLGAHQVVPIPGRVAFLPDEAAAIPVIAGATPGLILHAWSPVLDTTASGSSNQRSIWMQSTVNISGQGGAQSSFMQINIGTYFTDETKGGNLYTGGSSNSYLRPSAVSHTTRYTSALSSAETSTGTAIYGPAGEYAVLVPESTFTTAGPVTTRTPQAGFEQPFNNLPGDDYYYATPIAPATLPAGVGDQRSTRTMYGYAAALVDARSSGGVFSTYSLLNTAPEGVTISTEAASNRASGVFALFNPDNPGTNHDLRWGDLTGPSRSTSAFIDDMNFAMRQSFSTGSTYNGGNALVARIEMTAAGQAPDSDWLPVGVSFCTCQYLSWGYWQGDLRYDAGPRTGERDRVHLGTWVAGELPDVADLPLTGTATYSGHMIGNVENNFNKYVAAGSFTNQWDFSDREGNFNATFDGANYQGTMTGSPANVNFSGSIGDTNDLGRAGDVHGSFFRSPTDAAAYQAGSFRIGGPNYKATGTFAGQR
ncbi:MAG: hypothetical protein AB7O63_14255 [Reyranellaceae bacterium]